MPRGRGTQATSSFMTGHPRRTVSTITPVTLRMASEAGGGASVEKKK